MCLCCVAVLAGFFNFCYLGVGCFRRWLHLVVCVLWVVCCFCCLFCFVCVGLCDDEFGLI